MIGNEMYVLVGMLLEINVLVDFFSDQLLVVTLNK